MASRLGSGRPEIRFYPLSDGLQAPLWDGPSYLGHEPHVEGKVVEGIEPGGENFACLEQMTEI